MQSIRSCPKCNNAFDTNLFIPRILPCQHIQCHDCINKEYTVAQMYQCIICKNNFNQPPMTLQYDQQIVNLATTRITQIQNIQMAIQQMEAQKEENKKLMIQICQNKQVITEQLMVILEKNLFKGTNLFIKQVQQDQTTINNNINDYKKNLANFQSQKNLIPEQKSVEVLSNKFDFDARQKKGTEFYQKLEQFKGEISDRIRVILDEINQHLPQIGQQIIAPQPNLQQQEIKKVLTIEKYSNNLKTYDLSNNAQESITIENLEKVMVDLTQMEQIDDNTLIISGGFNGTRDYIICKGKELQNLKMYNMRYWHRTINAVNVDFIISGGQQNEAIADCEVFSFNTKRFSIIADIKTPVLLFGGCYLNQTVQIFGGDAQEGETDLIQIYDTMTDE